MKGEAIMHTYRDFLTTTLTAAAKIAVANFGNLSHSVKAGDRNQVLTETDLEIGHFLTDAIRTVYPDHNIIDEELGCVDNGSRYTWVVDPIDGTSNFAVGLPQYGIMLGLLDHDTPVAGGIALPAFGELYVATKGAGAWCNGQKIHVSRETDLANSLVAYGIDGHPEDPARTKREAELLCTIILSIRNLRSSKSVVDQAMVAKGAYGACANQTSKIWDNVAQQIIIEEAGGVYTDIAGNPMDYHDALNRSHENFTWLAGAPELHRQLVGVVEPLLLSL